MAPGAGTARLLAALVGLGEQVAALRLPLDLDDAKGARRTRREIDDQLHDYVLPRLTRLDAPVLAVVGGPTGAGKSTLVNSLVGVRISAAGVLRPTTRSAVLAHHPDDAGWFESDRVLPGLRRGTGSSTDPQALQLVASPGIPVGLAVVDAPDIDSVVTRNRDLATQLLAAADMWLFVTTAARYADAVPWEFLRQAVTRGTAVAVVLDRVPPVAVEEVRGHLAAMLTQQGLGGAPLFVIVETSTYEAMLPPDVIDPVRTWLHGIAGDPEVRAAVVRHTLDGAVRSLGPRVFELAAAADAQAEAVSRLQRIVDAAYDGARAEIARASSDGSLLRGEVLARWQEFVGTGELMRSLESKPSRLRAKESRTGRDKPAPGAGLADALGSGVEALVRAAADGAAETAAIAWAADPAGQQLLGDDDLRRSSAWLADASSRAVREWQSGVFDMVRSQATGKRAAARYVALGANGLGLLVMIVVFAPTAGVSGGEVVVARGATAVSQKVLDAVLGDQVVQSLAEQAHHDLQARVAALLDGERRRFGERLDASGVHDGAGAALRDAVVLMESAQ